METSSIAVLCLAPPSPPVRAKSSEEKFVKLREVYQKLRTEHIVLLRTNGETQKSFQSVEKEKTGMEEEVKVRKILTCLMVRY